MTTNGQIADTLERLADLLEFQGENPFRVRAYRNGAHAIRNLAEPIAAILADEDRSLLDVPGIGKGVAEKCREMLETGKLSQLERLEREVPPSVLTLLRIPGLGPKKAAALYHELKISTLDQLRQACEQGLVRALKGFGERTEQVILQGLCSVDSLGQRLLWAEAEVVARAIRDHLYRCASIEQLELAGSFRRGRETVGDLDILVVSSQPVEVMDCFAEFPGLSEVIGRGDTKMSIRVLGSFQVDLRVVPADSFGAALQYFTGSKEHNVVVRGRAKQRGLKINEYGVFRSEEDRDVYVGGRTEEEVYSLLDLPYFPPELREGREEFLWAETSGLPELVTLEDIQGDLHMHTTESDGKASLREMVAAAQARGRHYIAITDHSQRVSMARGLDPRRLRQQWKEIDQLRRELPEDFFVLKGVECDILEKGGMDLPDEVLAEADWVIASIHYGQRQSREQITERMLEALEHPYVDIIAHPTGRIINHRNAYELDLDVAFRAAREHHKLLELNASPSRLDLHDVHCATAKKLGIPIVISSDAHSPEGMDVMRYGVIQARRAGLTRNDVANARPWPEFQQLLRQRARR